MGSLNRDACEWRGGGSVDWNQVGVGVGVGGVAFDPMILGAFSSIGLPLCEVR